ncbi:MAG: SEC-C domain-containing protein [Patescibacteria group bacterium]|nr:SEC-C domain-containing protein [Patescibacteria group bacterium]
MIRGKYKPGTQSISLDAGSHLFDDDAPVVFHEVTHYWLSKFTNFGSVYSILSEIGLRPDLLTVDPSSIKAAIAALHEEEYMPQEGLAHFMQAAKIFSKGGMDGVKNLEDRLPNEPKSALSHLRFAVSWEEGELLNKLTEKVATLSLNTGLHEAVITNRDSILFDGAKLAAYLADNSNSPNKRFEKLCLAIEKEPKILMSSDEEICERAKIRHWPSMSNRQKAELNNALTAPTKNPTQLTEKDITTLEGNDALMPAIEAIVIRDANIETDAIVGLSEPELLSEIPLMRTIFVYNNPESPCPPDKFPFYSFSRRRMIINGKLPIGRSTTRIFTASGITKISDTASYDYEKNALRPERIFVNPDIIWYKNYNDIRIFLEMLESLDITADWVFMAFTDPHPFRFYFFRISGQPYIHVLVGYPYLAPKFEANKRLIRKENELWKLIKGKEISLNNFFHDMIGVHFLLNLVDMMQNADKHLERAKEFNKHGLGRNEPCICGSKRKFKRCHGA